MTAAGSFTLFQPNAKYKFYANDDKGLAAAAGFIGYIAINNRDAATTSDRSTQTSARRSRAGRDSPAACGAPSRSTSGNTGGVLLGYEQPLGGSKVSFVADWFSGKNFWGYFTPGISVTLPHNGLLNIGYSIGNDSFDDDPSNDNSALFVYYGITFP